MTTQPTALRLADELESDFRRNLIQSQTTVDALIRQMRQLHAENRLLHERRAWCSPTSAEYTRVLAQRDALLAMLRESLRHAEWRDKHIHPVDGETFQNWMLSVYLPVRLSETDKSPKAALNRVIDAAFKTAEESK